MNRGPVLIFAGCLFAILLCSGRAAASVEFCPATLANLSPVGAGLGTPSTQYSYELTALTPGRVDAWLIADTNAGWFAWKVSAIELKRTTRFLESDAAKLPHYDVTLPALRMPYPAVASEPLSVAFPSAVTVRHAWVTHAKADDAAAGGLAMLTPLPCDVPDFSSAGMADSKLTGPGGFATPSPLPSPNVPSARAEATSAPFATAECAAPFVEATVTRPAMPEFPVSVRQQGFSGTSVIEVAVGKDGQLVDAWVLASSGSRAIDLSALRAARASEYSKAISYCRAVNGLYIFRVDFQPR